MLGDITNLIGSIWADLVPTVTALAVYFCIADTVLILQCLYYNTLNARAEKRRQASLVAQGSETDPLIAPRPRGPSDASYGLPGSRRRSSVKSKASRNQERRDSLAQVFEDDTPRHAALKNALSVVMIIVVGAAGWALAWRASVWKPTPVSGDEQAEAGPIGAQIFGYASAILYLG